MNRSVKSLFLVIIIFILNGCTDSAINNFSWLDSLHADSNNTTVTITDSMNQHIERQLEDSLSHIDKQKLSHWPTVYPAAEIIQFSKTLLGMPYQYGAANPATGFDCSGFITYVYNHFGLHVPRSSIEFTNVGKEVPVTGAQPGDLILFTGTDSATTEVGHMGIITENTDSLRFIHSSSGKANGITITSLNQYYKKRFVKVISIKEGI